MTAVHDADHARPDAGLQAPGGLPMVVDNRAEGLFRVHRTAFVAEDIFEAEQRAIFDRSWLYVGHESEIAEPGAFRRRNIAGRSVMFVRDEAGDPQVLLNTCPHRGALVCRQDEGTSLRFQCFYHGWTFDTRGTLVGVPGADAYCDGFDKGERSLARPARVESYRGFYFLNHTGDAMPLVEYLAGAREYIDLVVDPAEQGLRVVPGSNRYALGANWKLLVENSMDTYHRPLHQTYFEYLADTTKKAVGNGAFAPEVGQTGETQSAAAAARVERDHPIDLGNGHAVIQQDAPYGRPIAKWHPLFGPEAKPEIERLRQQLRDRFGEERARLMAETTRNLFVFPNLFINDIMGITVRYLEPISPAYMEVTAWQLAPSEETGKRLFRRFDSYATFVGPAGFGTPDDIEALESCQQGFKAWREVPYSDVSRGMGRRQQIRDELQMRVFWRAWSAHLEGRPVPPPVTAVEVDGRP